MGHKVDGAKGHTKRQDNSESSYGDIESRSSAGGTETSGYDTDKRGKHSKSAKGEKKAKGDKKDKADKKAKGKRAEVDDVFAPRSESEVTQMPVESSVTAPPTSPALDDEALWRGDGNTIGHNRGYTGLSDETIQNIINGDESFADQDFPSSAATLSRSRQLIFGLYQKMKSGDLTEEAALDIYRTQIEQLRKKNQDPVTGWASTIEAAKEGDKENERVAELAGFTHISVPVNGSYPEATGDLRAAFFSTRPKNTRVDMNPVLTTAAIQDVKTGEKFQVSY